MPAFKLLFAFSILCIGAIKPVVASEPQFDIRLLAVDANEGQLMHDIDGDGQPEWIVNSWRNDVPMLIWRFEETDQGDEKNPARYKLKRHVLGETANGHGLGVGDISGDGRLDVLVGQGWYEQPAEGAWSGPWKFHKDWLLHSSLPMIVVDLDQDGDNDVIFGNGHDFGLQWWENTGRDESDKLTWKEHLIDRGWSQPHSMIWADINNDGQPDLITGKRYYAHNGGDPGGQDPPRLMWYQWDAATKSFKGHLIDEGHVGTGLQIVAEDLNGDGTTDVAVAGKSGTYVLLAQP